MSNSSLAKPTRIWMLTPRIGGYSEVWMYRQLNAMIGGDFLLLTHEHLNKSQFPIARDKIVELGQYPHLTRFKRLQNAVLNCRYGGFRRSREERSYLSKLILEQQPDVVLIHYGTMLRDYFPLFQKLNVPVVAHFNGFDLSRAVNDLNRKWRSYRTWLEHNARRVDGIVVVAEYMRQWLLKNGVSEDRLRKIPYGVPTNEFHWSSRVCDRGECRFLAVGRFTEKKRPDLTIRAFHACSARSKTKCSLSFIGGGEMLPQCRDLVSELGLTGQVVFHGPQGNEFVRKQMQLSSVFVQHSFTASDGDKEGWPVSVGEAAASGLPIVATAHAGIVDQVEHEHTGYLVREGDWEAMGDAMSLLAGSPELRLAMSKLARAKMLELDITNQTGCLTSFVCEVAANPNTTKNLGLL